MTVKWPVSHWLATLSMVGGPGRSLCFERVVVSDIGCRSLGGFRDVGTARSGFRLRTTGSGSSVWRNGCERYVLVQAAFWCAKQETHCYSQRAVRTLQQLSCKSTDRQSMQRFGLYAYVPRSLQVPSCFSPSHSSRDNSSASRENLKISSGKNTRVPPDGSGEDRAGPPPSMFIGYPSKRFSLVTDQDIYWYRNLTVKKGLRNQERKVVIREEPNPTPQTPLNNSNEKAQDSSSDLTVICFDIETTGFSASSDRIIEFAGRDLSGGECSTMETLVNPGMEVKNAHIHNISSQMVNNPRVPRWRDVALALLDFVGSRRKGQGLVILVAHNGRRFDVPFILSAFRECGLSVPSYWRFADSLVLARLAMKGTGKSPIPSTALGQLFKYYGLPSVGEAHRAMADVNMLSQVLQMLMNDLQMSTSDLRELSFRAEDVVLKRPAAIPNVQTEDSLEVADTAVSDNGKMDAGLSSVPWDLEATANNDMELENVEVWESPGNLFSVEDELVDIQAVGLEQQEELNDGQDIEGVNSIEELDLDDNEIFDMLDELDLDDSEEIDLSDGSEEVDLDYSPETKLSDDSGEVHLDENNETDLSEDVLKGLYPDVPLDLITEINDRSDSPTITDAEVSDNAEGKDAVQFADKGNTNLPHPVIIPSKVNGSYNEKDLTEVWGLVCASLQNQPATQALCKQKGVLLSIATGADSWLVSLGSTILFVKKFLQHEHLTVLEAAFTTVLKQSVKIDVSVLEPVKSNPSSTDT